MSSLPSSLSLLWLNLETGTLKLWKKFTMRMDSQKKLQTLNKDKKDRKNKLFWNKNP